MYGMLVLGERDRHGVVHVAVDEVVSVCLPENPTTGVRWVLPDGLAPGLVCLTSEYDPVSVAVGGGGLRTFQFRCVQRGELRLSLISVQQWAAENVLDTFTATIHVS